MIKNAKYIKETIIIGMTILVFGSVIASFVVSKCNTISRKKDQVISLIYNTDYKTS